MGKSGEMKLSSEGFAKLERQVLQALFAEPPRAGDAVDVEAFGDDGDQPVRYFIYADVLAELTKAARYRSQRAVAILLGHFALDGDGAFVEISAFEDLIYIWDEDDAGDVFYRGVMEHLAALTRREEALASRRHVVGMFWSEPWSEAKLSEDAAREHLTYFNLPYQVALVCDGERGQVGLYARGPRQRFFNAAIHLVSAREPTPDDGAHPAKEAPAPVLAGADVAEAEPPEQPENDERLEERPDAGALAEMMPETEDRND